MSNGIGNNDPVADGSAGDVRILRRLDLSDGPLIDGGEEVAGIGVVVDVVTAGADSEVTIVELAARRFSFDSSHVINRLDRSYVWRQDPGLPPSNDISRWPVPSDGDLAGPSIDAVAAAKVIGSADVIVAHGARFDRPLVESLSPTLESRAWGCSIEDVGWPSLGHRCTRLECLLTKFGHFQSTHDAQANVDATIQLLREEVEPGRAALDVLVTSAEKTSWIVRAVGAAFEHREVLRRRGYRWNSAQRVWWREIRDKVQEEQWLSTMIYRPGSGMRVSPQFQPVDWTARYA
jgi:DNA polymerase III subunit epsilon